ncbi:deoxyhypusine synthase [Chloroherpeton thalassium ATCC 35110]|uniref:Deoxyhypusine synthase-like protein n=1 Tax=Chloroherpeton thalassium (strain ATCC 35110 / GB-78) TaxID=517418 RepID=B3QRS7_CHLT3|nr:deoxyhypusine synthase [Chloroherpeton thalassium]ACF13880.1 deoxyhypusine synthase [Chloroherpeton thalassium ATCC 35110]
MSSFTKKDFLQDVVQHIDIKAHNVVSLVDDMGKTAFQARNLARAAKIYDMMLNDKDCAVILTLAGSLISAGLKQVIIDLIEHNMVDAIVSTGANIVDQDFFEALGFKHYIGTPFIDDAILRDLHIDRIYDTYIDEDDLRICDDTVAEIANTLEPRAYSSREFIVEMGRYLEEHGKDKNSIVYTCYKKGVPIFVPAFSDCSAGFGLVHHQWHKPDAHVAIDSAKDFRELTRIKIENDTTGILMVGGGVPKNFTQDIVVAAEVLGYEDATMHKYAIQITVADERDGGLSGSTLKEASSWGKVDTALEQMIFSEATIAFPLIAGYGYHKKGWEGRVARDFNAMLSQSQELDVK